MAKKNRANMATDITSNIYTNTTKNVKGKTAQDRLINLNDSCLNIVSDLNVPGGYLGLDNNGIVNSPLTVTVTDIVEATIDITGLTNINLNGITARIVNLTSSNSTETINSISNNAFAGIFEFRPETGLAVTFQDKAIGSGNIHLFAPSLIVYGTKYGVLSLKTRASEFFQNQFIDQYN